MKNKFIAVMFLVLTTINYSQIPCPETSTVTYANKIYNTVQIGTQCWLKENIDVGTMINGIQDQTNNNVIEKYCYNNDPLNCEKYGGLYNWNEAMKYSPSGAKVQGICPSGWRLPTIDEFRVLQSAVGFDGNALKDTTPVLGHVQGTNTSGFSALLSGTRGYGGHFSHMDVYAYFWSSSEYDATYTYIINLDYSSNTIGLFANGKEAAFSVRCLQGEGTTAVSESPNRNELTSEYSISQNYPNPFNPTTKISFRLPVRTITRLVVYDILGKEVSTLINRELEAGYHEISFDGSNLASGIYFYKIQTKEYSDTRKMILIK